MSYRYQFVDGNSLLVVCFSETIAVDGFEVLIRSVKSNSRFMPEMDRLLVFDKDTDMSDLSPVALASIKDAILELDGAGKSGGHRALQFRAAYVVTAEMQEIIARLYAAVWQTDRLHRPQFQIFSTVADALAWLGRGDIQIDFSAGACT